METIDDYIGRGGSISRVATRKKGKKKPRLSRAGRPPKADAKRRQTTREGRALGAPCPECGHREMPAPERVLWRRLALTGDARGVESEFPPEVLLANKLITQEMRDEAVRFAMLAWWLFGTPSASCAGIYDRMVAGGVGDDYAPRREGELDDRAAARIQAQKARFARMLEVLGAVHRAPIETSSVGGRTVIYRPRNFTPIRGTVFEAVRNCCQFLELPAIVPKLAAAEPPSVEDWAAWIKLLDGLRRLVAARGSAERRWRRRRAQLVQQLSAPT